METKEYFEKVMQDFNQHRNGRSLRKYCQDERIDYTWLQEYKRSSNITYYLSSTPTDMRKGAFKIEINPWRVVRLPGMVL